MPTPSENVILTESQSTEHVVRFEVGGDFEDGEVVGEDKLGGVEDKN